MITYLQTALGISGILFLFLAIYEANWNGRCDRATYYLTFACLEFVLLYGGNKS